MNIEMYSAKIDRIPTGGSFSKESVKLSTGERIILALSLHKLSRKNLLDRTPQEAWDRIDCDDRAIVLHFNPSLFG